jgi:hypothetical protein
MLQSVPSIRNELEDRSEVMSKREYVYANGLLVVSPNCVREAAQVIQRKKPRKSCYASLVHFRADRLQFRRQRSYSRVDLGRNRERSSRVSDACLSSCMPIHFEVAQPDQFAQQGVVSSLRRASGDGPTKRGR